MTHSCRWNQKSALLLVMLVVLVVSTAGGCINLGARNCPYIHGFSANHCTPPPVRYCDPGHHHHHHSHQRR